MLESVGRRKALWYVHGELTCRIYSLRTEVHELSILVIVIVHKQDSNRSVFTKQPELARHEGTQPLCIHPHHHSLGRLPDRLSMV